MQPPGRILSSCPGNLGGNFSRRFIEVLWLKALYVENDQVKTQGPPLSLLALENKQGAGPSVPSDRPPLNLVNPLGRLHSLASHGVWDKGVLWSPTSLFSHTWPGGLSCFVQCDFFSLMYGSHIHISEREEPAACQAVLGAPELLFAELMKH